jgi:hypothetical protein
MSGGHSTNLIINRKLSARLHKHAVSRMCHIVVINRGEVEIGTPREFETHFGFLPIKEDYYNTLELDYCLCQADLEETFKQKNIAYKKDCGDFYVGQLELVKGDDDV